MVKTKRIVATYENVFENQVNKHKTLYFNMKIHQQKRMQIVRLF